MNDLRASNLPPETDITASADVKRYLVFGFFVMFVLVGGAGVWATTTEIAGAVMASGRVVVDSNLRKVQHPTGGIVAEIHAKNGDRVMADQLLIRLDETITRANLQVVIKQLNGLAMRAARLAAERDGQVQMNVPEGLNNQADLPDVRRIIDGELSLFRSRRETREKQKGQLHERIEQHREEISGIEGQIAAKIKEISLIAEELDGLEKLEAQQLITTTRMTAMRREAARLEGERGQLQAKVAQINGQIAEVELQILGLEQEHLTKIVGELRQIESKQSELDERRVAAEDQLKRVDIRAPISGIVHQLAVHTVGGVISSAEPVMLIVPQGEKLVIEARVNPQDINQVHVGQIALVRFTSFNQRTTPELNGKVSQIAAELTRDELTGETYYIVRVELPESESSRFGDKALIPGMPADVQIRTEDRTALSYLVKPLQDQYNKAFRER